MLLTGKVQDVLVQFVVLEFLLEAVQDLGHLVQLSVNVVERVLVDVELALQRVVDVLGREAVQEELGLDRDLVLHGDLQDGGVLQVLHLHPVLVLVHQPVPVVRDELIVGRRQPLDVLGQDPFGAFHTKQEVLVRDVLTEGVLLGDDPRSAVVAQFEVVGIDDPQVEGLAVQLRVQHVDGDLEGQSMVDLTGLEAADDVVADVEVELAQGLVDQVVRGEDPLLVDDVAIGRDVPDVLIDL